MPSDAQPLMRAVRRRQHAGRGSEQNGRFYIAVMMDAPMRDRLRERAARVGGTLSEEIRNAVAESFEREGER